MLEQEAQKMQFVLQKERQEADRKRIEAQGIADYQHIISESLTDKQLQYEQIKAMKELAASTNAKMIIMGEREARRFWTGEELRSFVVLVCTVCSSLNSEAHEFKSRLEVRVQTLFILNFLGITHEFVGHRCVTHLYRWEFY